MESWTRRAFGASAAGVVATVAGCSGDTGESSETSSPRTTATAQALSERPTCQTTEADEILEVTTTGATVVATDRAAAESVRDELADETSDRVRLVAVERDGTERVAVEIPRDTRASDALGDVTEAFADRESVVGRRRGRSIETVRGVATRLRRSIGESDRLTPTEFRVRVVRPEPPEPFVVTTVLIGTGDASVLGAAESLAFRVATDDGEATLVTGGQILEARANPDGDPPNVQFTLTTTGARAFRQGLQAANALDGGRGRPLRLYYEEELVWDGGISPGFAESIRSGAFLDDPSFTVAVASPEEARDLAASMNLLTFDVPVRERLRRCS